MGRGLMMEVSRVEECQQVHRGKPTQSISLSRLLGKPGVGVMTGGAGRLVLRKTLRRSDI